MDPFDTPFDGTPVVSKLYHGDSPAASGWGLEASPSAEREDLGASLERQQRNSPSPGPQSSRSARLPRKSRVPVYGQLKAQRRAKVRDYMHSMRGGGGRTQSTGVGGREEPQLLQPDSRDTAFRKPSGGRGSSQASTEAWMRLNEALMDCVGEDCTPPDFPLSMTDSNAVRRLAQSCLRGLAAVRDAVASARVQAHTRTMHSPKRVSGGGGGGGGGDGGEGSPLFPPINRRTPQHEPLHHTRMQEWSQSLAAPNDRMHDKQTARDESKQAASTTHNHNHNDNSSNNNNKNTSTVVEHATSPTTAPSPANPGMQVEVKLMDTALLVLPQLLGFPGQMHCARAQQLQARLTAAEKQLVQAQKHSRQLQAQLSEAEVRVQQAEEQAQARQQAEKQISATLTSVAGASEERERLLETTQRRLDELNRKLSAERAAKAEVEVDNLNLAASLNAAKLTKENLEQNEAYIAKLEGYRRNWLAEEQRSARLLDMVQNQNRMYAAMMQTCRRSLAAANVKIKSMEALKQKNDELMAERHALLRPYTPRPDWKAIYFAQPQLDITATLIEECYRPTKVQIGELFEYVGRQNKEVVQLKEQLVAAVRVHDAMKSNLLARVRRIQDEYQKEREAEKQRRTVVWKGKSTSRYFVGLGHDTNVPRFLRITGHVRNRHQAKKETEATVRRVWYAKVMHDRNKRLLDMSMVDFFYHFLKQKFGVERVVCEWGYNLLDGLDRYRWDADCELFLKVLKGEVSEEVFYDQRLMIYYLSEMFTCLEYMRSRRSQRVLPMKLLRSALKSFFPTKSAQNLKDIMKALKDCFDEDEAMMRDYTLLFQETRSFSETEFVEEIRDQHLFEIENYIISLKDAADALPRNAEGRVLLSDIHEVWCKVDPYITSDQIIGYMQRGLGVKTREDVRATTLVSAAAFLGKIYSGGVVKRALSWDPHGLSKFIKQHEKTLGGSYKAYRLAKQKPNSSEGQVLKGIRDRIFSCNEYADVSGGKLSCWPRGPNYSTEFMTASTSLESKHTTQLSRQRELEKSQREIFREGEAASAHERKVSQAEKRSSFDLAAPADALNDPGSPRSPHTRTRTRSRSTATRSSRSSGRRRSTRKVTVGGVGRDARRPTPPKKDMSVLPAMGSKHELRETYYTEDNQQA